MKEQKLVSVSVFYKNNTRNGFGVTIAPEVYEAISSEAQTVWDGFKQECATEDAIAAILMQQLDEYGGMKEYLSTAMQMLVVMNILLLAEKGFLKQNEWNGTQYCYMDASAADIVKEAVFK